MFCLRRNRENHACRRVKDTADHSFAMIEIHVSTTRLDARCENPSPLHSTADINSHPLDFGPLTNHEKEPTQLVSPSATHDNATPCVGTTDSRDRNCDAELRIGAKTGDLVQPLLHDGHPWLDAPSASRVVERVHPFRCCKAATKQGKCRKGKQQRGIKEGRGRAGGSNGAIFRSPCEPADSGTNRLPFLLLPCL